MSDNAPIMGSSVVSFSRLPPLSFARQHSHYSHAFNGRHAFFRAHYRFRGSCYCYSTSRHLPGSSLALCWLQQHASSHCCARCPQQTPQTSGDVRPWLRPLPYWRPVPNAAPTPTCVEVGGTCFSDNQHTCPPDWSCCGSYCLLVGEQCCMTGYYCPNG
jgi:hypothetical protein